MDLEQLHDISTGFIKAKVVLAAAELKLFDITAGDGATAVVVGPVERDKGLIAQAHLTDGSLHKALVCTVKGKDWWKDGKIETATLDREATLSLQKSSGTVWK